MEDLINKWFKAKNPNGGYIFLKFVEVNKKLKQIVLSGNKIMDGSYDIFKYDYETKNGLIELKIKKFDIDILGESEEDLKNQLINSGMINEEEFELFFIQKREDKAENIKLLK